jgi:hypothetical protein
MQNIFIKEPGKVDIEDITNKIEGSKRVIYYVLVLSCLNYLS